MRPPSYSDTPRSHVYFPPEAADPDALESKHAVADLLRTLAESCATVDAGAAGRAALDEVAGILTEAREKLSGLPRVVDSIDGTAETSLAERGPFVGASNPLSAPLHLATDGRVTRGWAVYGRAYEGGIGDMHGGAVMAAFDDLLGCAQMVGPVVGRTGTLIVRFRAPSPIGRRIEYEGRLDRVEGRKVYCSGEARCDGRLLAEAEAIFVAPPPTSSTDGSG